MPHLQFVRALAESMMLNVKRIPTTRRSKAENCSFKLLQYSFNVACMGKRLGNKCWAFAVTSYHIQTLSAPSITPILTYPIQSLGL